MAKKAKRTNRVTAPKKAAARKTSAKNAARMKPTPQQALVVTLTGDRPMHEVAGKLKAAGLTVDQVLTSTGIVTGSAHPDAAKRLRKVRGVADVSPDHPVDIGPPGAPIS